MIDLEKMAKEHEKLFPNATLESQVWKLDEEMLEYKNAETSEVQLQERADIIIVCAGLIRWCKVLGITIFHNFYSGYYDKVESEVNRKWQINLKRKWEWNGKTYKHVKGTGE